MRSKPGAEILALGYGYPGAMIDLQILEALDVSLWLGAGRHAASYLMCDQSTISRHCRLACRTFMLSGLKQARVQLDTPRTQLPAWSRLLEQERRVHQQARILNSSRLRLHCQHVALECDNTGAWRSNQHYGCDASLGRVQRLLHSASIDAALLSSNDEWPLGSVQPHFAQPLVELPVDSTHTLVISKTLVDHQPSIRSLEACLQLAVHAA